VLLEENAGSQAQDEATHRSGVSQSAMEGCVHWTKPCVVDTQFETDDITEDQLDIGLHVNISQYAMHRYAARGFALGTVDNNKDIRQMSLYCRASLS